jgi:hypothetical protein
VSSTHKTALKERAQHSGTSVVARVFAAYICTPGDADMPILGATLLIVALAGATNMAYAGWFSDELPPANAKPLSEIIKAVEEKGYKTITDVEFDDGAWKIEVHQQDSNEVQIKVDPVSGSIR